MKKDNENYKNNTSESEMKKQLNACGDAVSKEEFKVPLDIPATPFSTCPQTCEEMINAYGTYNIQPTADTENDFPAIAQGTPDYIAERPLEFFREAEENNPASDVSDKHCL